MRVNTYKMLSCALFMLGSFVVFTGCENPEDWLAQNKEHNGNNNNNNNNVKKKDPEPDPLFVQEYVVEEPSSGVDVIKIRVKSGTSFTAAEMPMVKYNLKTPVAFIADDMTDNDLTMGWCLFNGYPTGIKYSGEDENSALDKRYCNDFVRVLQGKAGNGSYTNFMTAHTPYTYDTGDGKAKRWAMTSAVWGYKADEVNYAKFNAKDALGMMRMGHSFAQHDVDLEKVTKNSAGAHSITRMQKEMEEESKKWGKITGIGLKIVAEPGGEKEYIEAARISDGKCFCVFQQAGRHGYLKHEGTDVYYYNDNEPEGGADEDFIFEPITHDITQWADGSAVTDFQHKGHSAMERVFMTGGDETKISETLKENYGNGKIVAFGLHGINQRTAKEMTNMRNTYKEVWVTSIDEIWEYYYLKKKTLIECKPLDGGITEITFTIPRYPDHQFRDFTVNLPVNDVESIEFDGKVVTSGWRNNDGYCTVNLGLETRMYKYITEYMNIAYHNKTNTWIKRDLQYLIGLLSEGSKKDEYTALMDKLYK